MNKASEGISDSLLDLATYKYEDSQIAHYGNVDADQPKEEKQIKEEARRKSRAIGIAYKIFLTQFYGDVQHVAKYIVNKTANQIISQEGWGSSGDFYKSFENIGREMADTTVGFSNNNTKHKNDNGTYNFRGLVCLQIDNKKFI